MTNQLRSPLRSAIRSAFEHRRGGSAPLDPASLASSAFYDRTNLATLFQNSVGTVPVTSTAQTIGLGLDLSQGLALGPELAYFSSTTLITGNTNFASIVESGWYSFGCTYASGAGTVRIGTVLGSYTGDFFSAPDSRYVYAYINSGNTLRLTTASAGDDVITGITCRAIAGNHQSQGSAGLRPITAGSPIYANFDAVDDNLGITFPASLGAGCTVCRSLPGVGASISTGVTIGTTYTDNVDAHALLIFTAAQWAALSAGQISQLTEWLNKKAGL